MLMVTPSMALIALVALWPVIYGIWLSMHQYSLITAGLSRWASPLGLGNYIDQLKSSEFWTRDTDHADLHGVLRHSSRPSSASPWRWR